MFLLQEIQAWLCGPGLIFGTIHEKFIAPQSAAICNCRCIKALLCAPATRNKAQWPVVRRRSHMPGEAG